MQQFDTILADAATEAADRALATELSELLTRHYPGYQWAVNASTFRGVVTVENWSLSGQYGYTLDMGKLHGPAAIKKAAVLTGGEFLERYGLPTDGRTPDPDGLIAFAGVAAVGLDTART